MLRRTADDTDPTERVVVANADQLLIVVALADPPPRTGFVERALIAAYAGGLKPILCLTKTDLAPAEPFAAQFADLDLTVLTAGRDDPLDVVGAPAGRKVTVFLGHSGVGKSTLVNRLVPEADRATGEVSGVGKGKHTSTQSVALPLRGRRLGDRHPGGALVRAGAHRTRRCPAGVLGSGRGHRRSAPEGAGTWDRPPIPNAPWTSWRVRPPAGWPRPADCWRRCARPSGRRRRREARARPEEIDHRPSRSTQAERGTSAAGGDRPSA